MATETAREPFASWARLDLFGHVRHMGFVQEVELFGAMMVRIDTLPAEDGETGQTLYFGASAVYSLAPTTEEDIREEIARRKRYAARRQQMLAPIRVEELPPGDDHDAMDASGDFGDDEDDDDLPADEYDDDDDH